MSVVSRHTSWMVLYSKMWPPMNPSLILYPLEGEPLITLSVAVTKPAVEMKIPTQHPVSRLKQGLKV
jgi:hypothetical protein